MQSIFARGPIAARASATFLVNIFVPTALPLSCEELKLKTAHACVDFLLLLQL